VPQDLVLVVELDLEHGVGESFDDLPFHLDLLFFGHEVAATERTAG
jgi:hypothetical protein